MPSTVILSRLCMCDEGLLNSAVLQRFVTSTICKLSCTAVSTLHSKQGVSMSEQVNMVSEDSFMHSPGLQTVLHCHQFQHM